MDHDRPGLCSRPAGPPKTATPFAQGPVRGRTGPGRAAGPEPSPKTAAATPSTETIPENSLGGRVVWSPSGGDGLCGREAFAARRPGPPTSRSCMTRRDQGASCQCRVYFSDNNLDKLNPSGADPACLPGQLLHGQAGHTGSLSHDSESDDSDQTRTVTVSRPHHGLTDPAGSMLPRSRVASSSPPTSL